MARYTPELIDFLVSANKTVLVIDDYGGNLSDKQRDIITANRKLLDERGCKYIHVDNSKGMWFDFGGHDFKGKVKGAYNNKTCYARHCYVVLPNGWLT